MVGSRKQEPGVKPVETGLTGAEGVQQESPVAPESKVRVVRVKRSIWDDSMVRTMGFVAAVLVMVFLATIVGVLYFGFLGNETPQTSTQREVTAWEAAARTKGASVDQWQSFVLALIVDKQYVRASKVIAEVNANKGLDQIQGQNMLYCTAELQRAQGKMKDALVTYEQVMAKTKPAYEKELKTGGDTQNWAQSWGLHENYFLSALSRAALYRDAGQPGQALPMIDTYLSRYPRESQVLCDRAVIKTELGDTAGARADYNQALKFIPGYPEAINGLKKIGAGK